MFHSDIQYKKLKCLLDVPNGCLPSGIFLYGVKGTGRSSTLFRVLNECIAPTNEKRKAESVAMVTGRSLQWACVDCVECCTEPIIYYSLLRKLTHSDVTMNNVSNLSLFASKFQAAVERKNTILVFKNAERLRHISSALISSLLRLSEYTTASVCCVFISCVVWHKFLVSVGSITPVLIHFPNPAPSDIGAILLQSCEAEFVELCAQSQLLPECSSTDTTQQDTQQLLRTLVNLFLSVFTTSCRSVNELIYIFRVNMAQFLRPFLSGDVKQSDVKAVWKHLQPHFISASRELFLRRDIVADPDTDIAKKSIRLNTELPFYSKFLLVSAYLASHNPVSTDTRYFVRARHTQKRRRPPGGASGGARVVSSSRHAHRHSTLLSGPRAFTLQRLMAIFYFIVEDRVRPTVPLYAQISSLVNLRLLSRVGSLDNLDNMKFRCLCCQNVVESVASSVNFELKRHLWDFT